MNKRSIAVADKDHVYIVVDYDLDMHRRNPALLGVCADFRSLRSGFLRCRRLTLAALLGTSWATEVLRFQVRYTLGLTSFSALGFD